MNDLIIVEAAAGDAAAVLAHRNAVGLESDNLTYGKEGPGTTLEEQAAFIRKMAESKASVMCVGKIGMEIVALGTVSALGKSRIRHRAELGLTVRKAFWNQGIATKMMEALMDFAKDSPECEVVQLEVRSDNESARHLYEKFGFETIGVYEKFFKVGNHYAQATLMNCYL